MRSLLLLVAATIAAGCVRRPPPARPPETPPYSPPASSRAAAPADPPGTPAPPAPDLAPVRDGAEAVLRAQAEGYWRLFTDGVDFEPAIAWKGREELLSDATLAAAATAARAGSGDQQKASARLSAWLLGERLARETAEAARLAARAREDARFTWADHEVPLGELPALLAAEVDREQRRVMAEAAAAPARELLPLAAASAARLRDAAGALGYPSPHALAAELRGQPPGALAALAEDVLERTEGSWDALLTALARREGMERHEVRARDLPRLLRGSVPAHRLPADRQLTEGAEILAGMGIDLPAQANLRLDPAPRARKLPYTIALPVDPPGDVRLSVAALAGLDALRATLHELGVAEYYAHARAEPMELRRLGPAAIPEAWGRLFEEVAGLRGWLTARGIEDEPAAAEARAAAARRLLRARDAAARVLAEIALAEAPADTAREAAIAARAYGFPADGGDVYPWRAEPDPLLRTAERLRAELLAAQAEVRLAREAGSPEWWRSREAGTFLRAAWAEGSRRSPEELSRALGATALDAAALDRVVRERARL